MTKAELIKKIAHSSEISKNAAERALNATIGAISSSLKKGESVALVGFGTFRVGHRRGRTGRNPRTGEAIKIKPSKVAKFSAGKSLKDAVR